MRLLVTGGAGYIGSTVTTLLVEDGHEVTVLDDLSSGQESSVPDGVSFVRGGVQDLADEVLGDREAVREVTGRKVPVEIAPRRPGDIVAQVASAAKATAELGWRPQRPALHDIVADAWAFRS